ncbi:MAG: hypothetical protein D6B28_03670 [Gammaproteobacteria bacterium]|nr:MAG: hypothetical protein D6B28_03670 [Gammaproteobacteria bacterium]
MTTPNLPYEKHVSLGIIHCSDELKQYAEKIADEIPGLIDIKFVNDTVVFHYNNNGMSIDILAEFLQKIDIELEDSLINKLKICFHSFADDNAKSNATSKPSCCVSTEKIFSKSTETDKIKKAA